MQAYAQLGWPEFDPSLQASTSSSWANSGKPSRTRNRSSFHEPRRILTLPARHCELNGPKRMSLSPLSAAGVTVKPLSARGSTHMMELAVGLLDQLSSQVRAPHQMAAGPASSGVAVRR